MNIPELSKSGKSHCNGIYIERQAPDLTFVSFRNIYHNVYDGDVTVSYTIGNKTLSQIYLFTTAVDLSDNKNIKAIY